MPPRAAPTHFLCIPLAGPQLARSLAAFRADVTSDMGFALPGDAVRPLGTLHLTLGVASLSGESLGRAVEELQKLRPKQLLDDTRRNLQASTGTQTVASASASATDGSRPSSKLSIKLQGLRAMQSPSNTSVLYAPPSDAEGVLYQFCEALRKPFLESGVMVDDKRPLLLHATMINTIYVKDARGRRRKERLMLDARDMLRKYDGQVWAEDMVVERIALCRMGAQKVIVDGVEDERYEVEAEIDIETM